MCAEMCADRSVQWSSAQLNAKHAEIMAGHTEWAAKMCPVNQRPAAEQMELWAKLHAEQTELWAKQAKWFSSFYGQVSSTL